MPQLGVHAVIGLALARAIPLETGREKTVPLQAASLRKARQGARWGILVGNVLPDADAFVAAPVFLLDQELGLSLHRTFSHSWLMQAIAVGIILAVARARGSPATAGFARGLWIGMALHSFLDIFFWFTGIDLLWPLGLFGLPGFVDLWAGVDIPRTLSRLMGAAEYLALAAFYFYLSRSVTDMGLRLGRGDHLSSSFYRYGLLHLALTPVMAWLALSSPPGGFTVFNHGILIVIGGPLFIRSLFRARPLIVAMDTTTR